MVQEGNGKGDGEGGESERVRSVKEEKPKAKPAKTIAVKRIHKEGPAVLVEWQDGGKYRRGVVPVEEFKPKGVAEDVLEAALPYGEKWSDVSGVTVAAEQELYRAGIWTKDDLLKRSGEIKGILARVYIVPLFIKLLERAKED